ncbi:MAG: DUF2088 domain-containing protein [Armatimonadetes bacterium]|nr:DUF2088 domain-containing protein [Armatimonadota bacterium]
MSRMITVSLPLDIYTYPDIPLPEVWTVEQLESRTPLTADEVTAQARQAVRGLLQDPRLKAGATVAVGVGSRGLDNLVPVVRAVISELKANGLCPFIIPAMGSHGGATDEGQRQVLADYGVTEESAGTEIRSSMETVFMGELTGTDAGDYVGQKVYADKNAHSADAILLINRIKHHTDFKGEIESGIAKMSVIGLGKRFGAECVHQYGVNGLRDLVPRIARFLVAKLPIVGGVALIENNFGKTCEIHTLPANQIANEGEKALLSHSRALAPHLPFDELDALVVDEMGKNISGAGMDTHVIGRGFLPSLKEEEWGKPDVRLIAVLDLTKESHGNATALGLADITTQALIEKADFTTTFINLRTSGEGGALRGRIPLIMPTKEDCVRTMYGICGRKTREEVRFARIKNTADVQYIEISASLLEEARNNPQLRVLEGSHPLDLNCSVSAC